MPNAPPSMSSTTISDPQRAQEPSPPGQERPYPQPTKTGKAPFEFSATGLKGETTYWVWGDLSSGKTPLICMHGGPGATHTYLRPISLVYQDYGIPVVMYDQIGCGKSTRFQEKRGDGKFWTPELFMAEIDNLKSHLGIKEFDFLGQSWGGMCGGQYAIEKQPPGLRKLIISDSPSDMVQWVKTANRLRDALPKDVQKTLDDCEREGKTDTEEYKKAVAVFYGRHVCRVDPPPPEFTATFDALEDDSTVYETMNGPSEFYVVGTLKTWNINDGLKKITAKTCPGGMLIINGYYDEAQDETCTYFFTQPSCRVKWIRYALSSHMPMLEETEKYVRDLGMFLTTE